MLVPWTSSVRAPGLTIHVRRGEVYHEEPASRAFPGWKAQAIHRALTGDPMSEPAWRALERTALAMGAREGTTPEHDPLSRSISLEAQARGRSGMLAANVLTVLKARGIEVASDLTEYRELFGALTSETLVEAALACTGGADFRRLLREPLGLHGVLPISRDPER